MNTSLLTAISLVSRIPRAAAKAGAALAAGAGGLAGARSGGHVRTGGATNDLFGVNNTDITRQKIRLMERVGHAFGVSMDDFGDLRSFGRAVREKMAATDSVTLKVIEARLRLPEMALSLIDVVDAMETPGGGADGKLEAALRRHIEARRANKEDHPLRPPVDDIGIYGIDRKPER